MPTKISWTDETWNPIRGTKGMWHCTKVSEGCRNCYAERFNIRKGGPEYVVGADTLRLDEKVLAKPLHWKKPRMVFVCSMTDLFHEDVPFKWIADVFTVMGMSTQHTYQILTKRPQRLREFYEWNYPGGVYAKDWLESWPNVWLGVSVENQQAADERIPLLLEVPAAVRFLSIEPLLGPVDLDRVGNAVFDRKRAIRDVMREPLALNEEQADHAIGHPKIHWAICGGESGCKARPMHPDWARSLRDQCRDAGVPFHFKQWGEWTPHTLMDGRLWPYAKGRYASWLEPKDWCPNSVTGWAYEKIQCGTTIMARVGKKAAGHLLDGKEHMEFPALDRKA